MHDVTVGAIGLGVVYQLFSIEEIKRTIDTLYILLYISVSRHRMPVVGVVEVWCSPMTGHLTDIGTPEKMYGS